METKLFEIRDRMTFIPALAVRLEPSGEPERYLLARSGFGLTYVEQGSYVFLAHLTNGTSTHDPQRMDLARLIAAHDADGASVDHRALGRTGQRGRGRRGILFGRSGGAEGERAA